ncbi:hypothetical protein MN546_04260 [Pseudomonas lundensis]|uniref:hypothetical protein n=1 Tax=Pseudomonas lundensis TaxID=86185 RepID=UPI001473920D|nr:hypothetical protein [Pseudomonas lundensis]MCT8951671.1 hypothetical protein [Pseudomonas lundensis]NNA33358.1 hypothetical protein [Pseudomonas lundensis]
MSTEHDHSALRPTRQVLSQDPQERMPCETWDLHLLIEGTGMSTGASAVEFKGKLYIFYALQKAPGVFALGYTVLFKNSANQMIIQHISELPTTRTSQRRPSVTVYADHLYCFYTAPDKSIRFITFSGTQWSPVETVPQVLTSDAPSAVGNGVNLYLALRGADSRALYYKVLGPSGWQPHVREDHKSVVESPSLCIHREMPFVSTRSAAGQLVTFQLIDEEYPIHVSNQPDTYGASALHTQGEYFYCATRKRSGNQYTVEMFRPYLDVDIYSQTAGRFVSAPCLTSYLGDMYLIGQRPCQDLALLKLNPVCITK